MVLPRFLPRINKVITNRLLRHLVGIGPFAELEHVGRSSGRTYRTTLLAFREADTVTIALTYGPDVDWLNNLRAHGGRMRLGQELLTLGGPTELTTAVGLSRMPWLPRHILPLTGTDEFIELPILARRPRRRW